MVIFDFDQTLVDTGPVEHLRTAGKWREVMAAAPKLMVYDGINELLAELHAGGHTLAIVTKSPDMVARAFIKQHRWPIDIIVGYHQVRRRKPDPEGLLLAMEQAGADAASTFHVGDQVQDTEAARAAGVVAIGSAWGIASKNELVASAPHFTFDTVADLRDFFAGRFGSP